MSAKPLEPVQTTKVWENAILQYDQDLLNKTVLVRIRLLNREPPTPRPSGLIARIVTGEAWKAPTSYKMRYLSACFADPNNKSGEAERTVYNPYRPGTPAHNQLTKETFETPNVLALTYVGETLYKQFEAFV